MIASTLLAMSVCWSTLLTVQSRELTATAHETNVAVGILETQMAECLTLTREELTGGTLTPGTNIDVEALLNDQALQYATPNYADGDALPKVLELQLSLIWTGVNRRTRTLTVRGLRR